MQITIDSNESLSTVTSVIGALYGVELTVNGGSSPGGATGTRRGGRRATKAAKATKTTRRGATGRRPGRRAGGADASVIRQWAIDRGLTVSSRGQLSKSVLDAYRAANR